MPKYYEFKVAGYYLYFTSFCVVECMHVHAKFFVRSDGSTKLADKGILTDRDVIKIQAFIKDNYKEMYLKWLEYSTNSFYDKK